MAQSASTNLGKSGQNQVIALTSGKGGVGKSTLCVLLGLGDALRGKRVLVIEFDAGLRGLDLMMGIADRVVYDLGDLLEGRCTISKAIAESPLHENLNAIVAPVSLEVPMKMEDVRLLIDGLRGHFDRLFLDMPAGLGFSSRLTAETADAALIAAVPDAVCVRDGGKMAQELEKRRFRNYRLVINRVEEKLLRRDVVTDLDAVIDGVGAQLIGVFPGDADIPLRLTRGLPLRENHRVLRIAQAVSRRLDGEYVPLIFP